MKWLPEDFGNITSTVCSSDDVWVPDLTLANNENAEEQEQADFRSYAVAVRVKHGVCAPIDDVSER